MIKNKVFGRLRQLHFWIDPTSIKCHETSHVGFLLYAHPDLTYSNDIVEILAPIAKEKLDKIRDFKFDAQAEKLNVTSGLEKISEKVVMIRSTPRQSENFQNILSTLFVNDDETNIQTLRKYMFVLIVVPVDNTKATLQGLLRTQGNFRRNVNHYIITNIYKISNAFQHLWKMPTQLPKIHSKMTIAPLPPLQPLNPTL